jgi:hypothetical protein
MRRGAGAVVALVLWAGACSDDVRRTMPDGFPEHDGPLLGFTEPVEETLRSVLVDRYHVRPEWADCMIEQARTAPGWPTPTTHPDGGALSYDVSGEQLNAWARACGVDFDELWYTTD